MPGETLRADAVVVGSGAGGAPVAARLAEAGLDVVVLEAGERLGTADFDGDAGSLLPRLMHAAVAEQSGMEVYAGRCLGGSTVVNDALCWRPPPEVLAGWRRDHGLAGLTDAAFAPFVERVWRDLHVEPTGRSHLNRNARRLELGAARLGWAAEAMPRNVRGCAKLGLCNLGCPTGAKQSMLLTYLPRAERAGARVRTGVRAERVEIEAGVARGVLARGADGAPLRVRAPRVCLAAGVLETPALLLRSGLSRGVGRDLQLHSSVHVTARFPEPVHGYYGPTMAYAVSEFSDVNGHGGPGFMLENVSLAPVTTATALPGFGAEHARAMEQLPHLGRTLVVLRDRTRGRLSIDGDGEARLAYAPVEEDLARLRQGMKAVARAFFAADALEVWLPVNGMAPVRSEAALATLDDLALDPRAFSLLYAVHLFGGASMASRGDTGFCDEEGRSFEIAGLHVVDASSLPGNTGVNPQVTIQANALRIADAMLAREGAA